MNDACVLVLGLGASGLAIARWCVRAGARVVLWDSRLGTAAGAALTRAAAERVPQATLYDDQDADRDVPTRIFKSPGIAPHDPALARFASFGIEFEGELDLFAAALADLKAGRGYAPDVVAITGTNGKTTTTAMTALIVERAGRRVAVAGNIGPTMLDTLADALDAGGAGDDLPDVWVLELSSFQLHGARGFEPSAAAVLNVTQDHLDWHGTIDAYAADKARIFGNRATMVVNRDDALVEAMTVPPPAAKPVRGRRAKAVARRVVRFGTGAPARPGDFGIAAEHGVAWLVRASEDGGAALQRLMPADALRVRGRHNAANALAALALATAIGCPLAPLLHALRDYRGEPHRVEFVASVGPVDAFDDSKGTNVGATVAAIDGLGADRAPAKLVLVAGGDGKGQDFAPLAPAVARHVRAVMLLGRDAAAVAAAVAPTGVPVERHATLDAATRAAFDAALPGDAVLLSPACASLDMFRDYAHRAEVYVAAVRAVAADHGAIA